MMVGRKSLTAWLKQLVLPVRNRLNWSCWRRGRFCPEERSCIYSPFSDGCILFWPQYVAWICMDACFLQILQPQISPQGEQYKLPQPARSQRDVSIMHQVLSAPVGSFRLGILGSQVWQVTEITPTFQWGLTLQITKCWMGWRNEEKWIEDYFQVYWWQTNGDCILNVICIRWYHLLALPFTFTCRTCAGFWSRSSWWSWSLSTKDTQRPNPTRHPHVSSQFLIFGIDLRIQDLHSDPLKSSCSQCFLLSCLRVWKEFMGRKWLDLISPISPLLQQVPTLVDQRL